MVWAPMATKPRKKKWARKRRPLVKGKPAKKAAKAPKPDRPAGTDPKRVAAILAKLDEAYPSATCELNHENAFQLLIATILRSEEHTSELQSRLHLVCRLLL